MKKVYYRSSEKSVCADVIPFFEKGKFKLFYLLDYRNKEVYGEGCPWCLLETDLKTYKDYGPTLLRGNINEQDLYVFTGSIIKYNDEYVIYYTGHNPHLRAMGLPEQKILRAFSNDLINWKKDNNFVFEAPDYLEKNDFRDPFVFYDEIEKKYKMLLAARRKSNNPFFTNGVTLLATSKDFYNWKLEKEPFYNPHSYFTHECPDLFKIGEWWYLVFSEFTDKVSTTYRMSKSQYGPWYTPKVNTFDGHAFYAAKSCEGIDGRRIIFGWNCIRNNEQDSEPWQWGGTIIPHEIVQNTDGTLGVKCPKEISEAFNIKYELNNTTNVGKIKYSNSSYVLGDDGLSIQMFNEIPSTCKIQLSFCPTDERGDFGVILRGQNNLEKFYTIKFEPKHNRMAMDKCPRTDSTIFCQVDTERYIELIPNKEYKLLIIMQESVLEVYVNEIVAMSARLFDIKNGSLGIYSNNTQVMFKNIQVME